MTILYHYHPDLGTFSGQSDARPCPITGTPLVPGHTTLIAPPPETSGRVRVFHADAWHYVEDHRGTTYWLADGSEHRMDQLGPLPDAALSEAPIQPAYPTFEEARSELLSTLNQALRQLTGTVPALEHASWPTKAAAARAVLDDSAAPHQAEMIAAEAAVRGKAPAQMATLIVERATRYEAVIARTAGLRANLDAALEAVSDPFDYAPILEDGKAQLAALAAEFGTTPTPA